jgi:hypothetical protein
MPPPVDPGWGQGRPPHIGGGPIYGGGPVDPGWGQGHPGKPPMPPVGIWPGPPQIGGGPIIPPEKPPERPINRPENPIELPPDQVWPPLTGSIEGGAQWVLIYIPGHGYEWVYLDLGGPKAK